MDGFSLTWPGLYTPCTLPNVAASRYRALGTALSLHAGLDLENQTALREPRERLHSKCRGFPGAAGRCRRIPGCFLLFLLRRLSRANHSQKGTAGRQTIVAKTITIIDERNKSMGVFTKYKTGVGAGIQSVRPA